MSSIQIADKTTLDNIDTNTTNLLSKGGIRYNTNSSKYQTYNTNTNTWIDTDFGGGGANPTLIVKNYNSLFDNLDITLSNTLYNYTETHNMSTNDYIIFTVPYLDNYNLTIGTDIDIPYNINIDVVGGLVWSVESAFSSFRYATNSQLDTMLKLHYNNIIDISDYWAIGDTRTISLFNMGKDPYSNVKFSGQNVDIAIIDFDHDDLVDSISNHTKAAITLSQINCLNASAVPINSSYTSIGSWDGSDRRNWCNNIYYNAIEDDFKSIIKKVNKITAETYNGDTNKLSEDYCWLLASGEIYGGQPASSAGYNTTYYSNLAEFNALSQYPYYIDASRKIKYINNTTSTTYWYTRSPYYYHSLYWCHVNSSGYAGNYEIDDYGSYGIRLCVAFCL